MSLPNLPAGDKFRREVRTEWGGLNLNENAGDGELIEAMNMSSREYPLLANSRLRGSSLHYRFVTPFFYQQILGALCIDGNAVKLAHPISYGNSGLTLNMTPAQADKAQCVSMNQNLYIFPAKQYTQLYSHTLSNMETSWETSLNGRAVVKNGTYAGVPAAANTISAPTLSGNWPFNAGDAVKITGIGGPQTLIIREVDNANKELRFYENTFELNNGYSYFCKSALSPDVYWFNTVVAGDTNFVLTQTVPAGSVLEWSYNASSVWVYPPTGQEYSCATNSGPGLAENKLKFEDPGPRTIPALKIERLVPDMDFVFVNDNRMWGCRNDTIYASKLGDPLNWNVFDGLSTDSWTATTGTDGHFTAGVSFQGYPTFFKENAVFQVIGDNPSNFTIRKYLISGVASSSSKSVVEIGNSLIYYAPCGFVQWNGVTPSIVSLDLGMAPGKRYAETAFDIRAGTDTVRYYVSLRTVEYVPEYDDERPVAHVYVYDTRYGIWHEIKLPSSYDLFFATDGAKCCMLNQQVTYDPETYDPDYTAYVYDLANVSPTPDLSTDWRVTFADSTRAYKTALTGSESKKGVLRLLIRCRLAGTMKIWIAYDGGEFEEAAEFGGEDGMDKGSRVVPLILRRCDFWQLRLTGTGDAVIYSIAVEKYGGEWQQA